MAAKRHKRRSRAERDNSRSEPAGCLRRQTFKRASDFGRGSSLSCREKSTQTSAILTNSSAEAQRERLAKVGHDWNSGRETVSHLERALLPVILSLRRICDLCLSSPAWRQMPEEIRGSSFLRMTNWGQPPSGRSAPWLATHQAAFPSSSPSASPRLSVASATAVRAPWREISRSARVCVSLLPS